MADQPSAAPKRHQECAMCMEKFTSPRLLPCFHTFCLGCLRRLVPDDKTVKSFLCPTCRTSIPVPSGGLDKFQVNFYLETETESASGPRTCDMCEEGTATRKCWDCDQFACDKCTKIHASISATKSHTVLKLDSGSGGAKKRETLVTKERYCRTHKDEKLRFFCTKCGLVVCRDCKLTSHEGHPTLDLSQKSTEARDMVLKVTAWSRDSLEPKLRQAVQEAQQQKEIAENSKKEALQTLTLRANSLKRGIDECLETATQQLSLESENVNQIVEQCLDNMTHELASFLSLIEHAQRVAQSGCDADILELPGSMKEFFAIKSQQPVQQAASYHGFVLPAPDASRSSSVKESGLKSFVNDNWRVSVKVVNTATQIRCGRCLHPYQQGLIACPHCGAKERQQQRHQGSRGRTRCAKCGTVFYHGDGCPNCEPGNPEAKSFAAIISAITTHMGQVSTHSEHNDRPSAAPKFGQQKGYSFGSASFPMEVDTPKSGEVLLSKTISDDISSVQSLLSKW